MTKKLKKYLIETSAVPPSVNESTPAHCAHFREQTSDGSIWTSVYIRKEFIRRWICYYIRLACEIDHYTNVSDALFDLEHDFGRGPKVAIHAIANMLKEKGELTDCRTMAEEFARLAIIGLRKFDRTYRSIVVNRSGCKLGGKSLTVDFNCLFDDLRSFASGMETATGCKLGELLRFGKPGGAGDLIKHQKAAATEVGQRLEKLSQKSKKNDFELTCRHCQTIGDAVIALEQQGSWCLLHVDGSFNDLCDATGRVHKQILSERAVEKEARAKSQGKLSGNEN